MSSDSVETFWDFSVRTYRTEGVPDACLSLQNEYGIDVNMFLYCCWLAVRRGEFDEDLWNDVIEFSTEWAGKLVKPLRLARTWMKHSGCPDDAIPTDACVQLREKVKSVEFDAEKMQQDVLELLSNNASVVESDEPSLLSAVLSNLHRYYDHLGLQVASEVAEKSTVIIAAAFPDLDKQKIFNDLLAFELA